VFPDKPVTQRAAETRMGKGKGAVDHWVAVVRPGRIIFELAGLDEATSLEAMRLASYKLALKTKVVVRRDIAQLAGRPASEEAAE
jgi:large subunit ribosomal protein L16